MPQIRFSAPPKLVGYLTFLAQNTILGATAGEVALTLLTLEAERRLLSDYHKMTVPTAEPPPDGGSPVER